MPPRRHCRLLESYFGPLGGHLRPQGVHFWPIKSYLGQQVGHLGPPGKSVWTSGISLRVITQGQRKIVENPREVYRNLKGSTLVCKEAIWHFLGFQRDHLGLRGDDLWLHRCHLGPLGSHLRAQGCPWGALRISLKASRRGTEYKARNLWW